MLHQSTHRVQFLSKLLNEKRHGLTVSEIEEALEDEGFEKISVEGLRKALNKMHKDPLVEIERVGTGYADKFVGTAESSNSKYRRLTPQEMGRLALLAQTDISQVFPSTIREKLTPYLTRIRDQVAYLKNDKSKGSVDRVRLRRPSVRLAVDREEPEIRQEVETVVHEALTDRMPLTVTYFSGHLSDSLVEAKVYPIGLDCQLRWVTLVCQFAEPYRTQHGLRSEKYGEDYVQMPMHRILKAKADKNGKLQEGFDFQFNMDDYIARAEPDRPRGGDERFTQGRIIKLVARVTVPYANDLLDSPLITQGKAQSLTLKDDGWYMLTAEVMQSDNLLWWCAAMAGDLVVMEPESFRQEVMNFLDSGRALYD